MDEEYLLMREALIALLCVGEKINHIYLTHGGYNVVYRDRIVELTDGKIVLDLWGTCCDVLIEHYNGELYIWSNAPKDQKDRVKEMIEIINSDKTHHG